MFVTRCLSRTRNLLRLNRFSVTSDNYKIIYEDNDKVSVKKFDIDETFSGRRVSISGYSSDCFVVNDVEVRQSVVLLPNSFLLWEPIEFNDITISSLAIFSLTYPSVEVS